MESWEDLKIILLKILLFVLNSTQVKKYEIAFWKNIFYPGDSGKKRKRTKRNGEKKNDESIPKVVEKQAKRRKIDVSKNEDNDPEKKQETVQEEAVKAVRESTQESGIGTISQVDEILIQSEHADGDEIEQMIDVD